MPSQFPVGEFTTGAKSSIGTSAVQITTSDIKCIFGVLVKADDDNSGDVYIGPKGVTAGTADATDGIRLKAGDSVFIEIDNANKVYAIGSAAGQKVYFVAA